MPTVANHTLLVHRISTIIYCPEYLQPIGRCPWLEFRYTQSQSCDPVPQQFPVLPTSFPLGLIPRFMLTAARGGPCKTWIISFCSIKSLQSLLTPYSKIQIPVTSPSYLPEYPSHRSSSYPQPYSLCILLRDPSKHVPTTGPSHHLSSVSWTSHFLYSSITSFSSLLKCHCIRVHS